MMLSQAASADLDRSAPDAARERLALVESTARDNLAEARALVAAAAPAPLQDGTLGQALRRSRPASPRRRERPSTSGRRRAGAVERRGGRPAAVRPGGAGQRAPPRGGESRRRLPGSGGPRDGVGRPDGATVVLEVTDDGRGLGPGVVEGFGLRGMRERVAASGGEVSVVGTSGGTTVRVELPLRTAVPPSAPVPRPRPPRPRPPPPEPPVTSPAPADPSSHTAPATSPPRSASSSSTTTPWCARASSGCSRPNPTSWWSARQETARGCGSRASCTRRRAHGSAHARARRRGRDDGDPRRAPLSR
ncbi:hypothetical protein NKG05_05620 [Oerskovia sp. M15]